MLLGYARVSTDDQHLNLQHDALSQAGCDQIFDDHGSGATADRAGLRRVLAYARTGDTIVVWRLDRLSRSLKDLIDVEGDVTTAASRVLADRVAPADATIVTRLREAGAIVLGKTNLHEFALGTTSEDSAFGAVHNPIDPMRSAGGSSGGPIEGQAC